MEFDFLHPQVSISYATPGLWLKKLITIDWLLPMLVCTSLPDQIDNGFQNATMYNN